MWRGEHIGPVYRADMLSEMRRTATPRQRPIPAPGTSRKLGHAAGSAGVGSSQVAVPGMPAPLSTTFSRDSGLATQQRGLSEDDLPPSSGRHQSELPGKTGRDRRRHRGTLFPTWNGKPIRTMASTAMSDR